MNNRLKDKIDKIGNSIVGLKNLLKEVTDFSSMFIDENDTFTTNLVFDRNKTIVVTGSGTPVFKADLTNSKVGATIAMSIEADQLTDVDFSDSVFEIRRNDFDATVDCVIYCSYEFDKVAVSILPKVAV